MLIIIAAVLTVTLAILLGIYFSRSSSPDKISPNIENTTTDNRPEVKADYPGDSDNPDIRFQSFDWLSDRTVTLSDLAGLSKGDLRILRNAIFARHGYRFKSADLKEYFGRFAWYSPDYDDVTPFLSTTEQANIATIQRHEGGSSSSSTKSSGKAKLGNVGYTDDYSDIVCYIYLDRSDLAGMSDNQLRILRNTIYARHGRRFKDAALQNYFNHMPWYSPSCNEVSPSALSAVEKHNIQLIQSLER